jgi:hypothetical protein
LTVAFTSPVDTASLSFAFSDPAILLTPQWNPRRDTLALAHGQQFSALGWYTLVINGLRDSAGAALGLVPDSATFRATDTVRPRIRSTTPADGATGVPLNAKLYVKFTKPMVRSSFQYGFNDTSIHFTKAWYSGDTLVVLSHTKAFDSLNVYSLTVTATRDTFGNDLADGIVPNPFSFTTLTTGVAGSPEPPQHALRIGGISPNPAAAGQRPSLELELPAGGDVSIHLYNGLGQRISTGTNRGLPAGRNAVRVCDTRLGPGLYFVRIQAGGTTAVRKFIVVR